MKPCQRNHSEEHQTKRVIGNNCSLQKFCDYIIGYRLKEGKGSEQALMCGDLPIGQSIPTEYQVVEAILL